MCDAHPAGSADARKSGDPHPSQVNQPDHAGAQTEPSTGGDAHPAGHTDAKPLPPKSKSKREEHRQDMGLLDIHYDLFVALWQM